MPRKTEQRKNKSRERGKKILRSRRVFAPTRPSQMPFVVYIAPARAASEYRAVAAVPRDDAGALSVRLPCHASAGVTPMSSRRSASSSRRFCNCQSRERGEAARKRPSSLSMSNTHVLLLIMLALCKASIYK
ncbi:hypothetical protein ASD02_05990 [Ensifer sp. Root1252]|nr:hypothetical protein ASD00_12060 [Ensifer sp. Root31]KQW58552.1 hypothetical protein ASD02_05990 [Ensifer sp. Root1252]KQW62510.1 hypothetical protein ASD03_14090 [Ensifer sp. Root127]KQY78526.1 hypothetical protein ASD52_01285 [Ensifer sp. Root142]KRC67387.1 hypothetical protein ASE32_09450 [Ensifer sp. Root231]KRC98463.1 hypothetical protein ASE47_04640 [Ensifer sp. Root258]OMQ42316.1 hypothetical protein BKP54_24570 [Ensifer sp. 1H6]PSS65451.1 hypothetical protein C6558_08655 [Ensifer 